MNSVAIIERNGMRLKSPECSQQSVPEEIEVATETATETATISKEADGNDGRITPSKISLGEPEKGKDPPPKETESEEVQDLCQILGTLTEKLKTIELQTIERSIEKLKVDVKSQL